MSVSELFINNVRMPTPALKGVSISREPIWSAASGRTSSGRMVGSVVARKTTLKLKWPPLTMAEAAALQSALEAEDFLNVRFTDAGGTTQSLTMYAGAASFTQYSWAEGMRYVVDAAVELIEQ